MNRRLKAFLQLVLMSFYVLVSTEALAQSTATPVVPGYNSLTGCTPSSLPSCFIQFGGPFVATGQAALTATTTSSNVALGSAGPTVVVTNAGTSTAFVTLGGAGVTATTASTPVFVGYPLVLQAGSNTFLAGITATGTAALTITTGTGTPNSTLPGTSSGGGGGTSSVNLAQILGAAISNSNSLPINDAAGSLTVDTGTPGTFTATVVQPTASQLNVTLGTGANVVGALTANQSVNLTQVNGVSTSGGVPVTGSGTAGTPAAGVLSVQGVTGGTPQNVDPDSVVDGTLMPVTNGGATGSNAIILGPLPTQGYQTGHVYISATGVGSTGTIVQQLASDGVTWITTALAGDTSLGVTSTSASAGASWSFYVWGQQIRVIQNGVTSGTTVGGIVLKRGTVPTVAVLTSVAAQLIGTNPVTPTSSSAASAGVAPLASAAAVATQVVKASAGNLHGFIVSNIAASTTWAYAINAVSAPASGSVVTPLEWVQVPATATASWGSGTLPAFFSTGVTLLCSSTGPTASSFIFTTTTSCAFTAMVQ